ncbi:MAG: PQQ-binding-like beta-propeller repeat protein [Spirochaetales bacterium]|jgi:outer membrane protein assembly factor BamB|nr:PQQ-binding-like beta-propeller repeat protein [Spirochaetales bacterium]
MIISPYMLERWIFRRGLLLLITLLLVSCQLFGQTKTDEYLWRISTGGRIRGRAVTASYGVVYALSEDRHMYAVQESTGRLLWKAFLGGRVWNSLCIGSDGTLYTVLKDGDLIAVNPQGGVVWRFKASGLPAGSPAAGRDGTVYFALESRELIAVSHTGRERWRVILPSPPVTGPAIGLTGELYIGCEDRQIYAVTPWGEISWTAVLAGVPGEPAVSSDGTLYVGTDYGSLVALAPDGYILWDFVTGSPFLAPVIGRDRVFAADRSGGIYAVSFEGSLIWEAKASATLSGGIVHTAGNDLIALTSRESLIRYRDDGVLSGSFSVKGSGDMFSVSPTGKYLFSRKDWNLYAYQGGQPERLEWSQAGRDSRQSSNYQMKVATSDWLDQFRGYINFEYLEHLGSSDSRDSKNTALLIIEELLNQREPPPPFLSYFLGELASEGTLKTLFSSGRLLNDFPDIRSRGARLLSEVGTLQDISLLIRLLTFEYDSVVQREIISALGALMSDQTGDATAAISVVIQKDLNGKKNPDPHLAMAGLKALEAIHRYAGSMPHDSGYETLFAVYRGNYQKDVREYALAVIRGLGG